MWNTWLDFFYWIFGSAKQPFWTQKIFRSNYKFQNPLHQNYKHVRALQALLGLGDQQVHSVVVFVGGSRFKTPLPENVTQGSGYVRYIKSKKDFVLSPEQVAEARVQERTQTPAFSVFTSLHPSYSWQGRNATH